MIEWPNDRLEGLRFEALIRAVGRNERIALAAIESEWPSSLDGLRALSAAHRNVAAWAFANECNSAVGEPTRRARGATLDALRHALGARLESIGGAA